MESLSLQGVPEDFGGDFSKGKKPKMKQNAHFVSGFHFGNRLKIKVKVGFSPL